MHTTEEKVNQLKNEVKKLPIVEKKAKVVLRPRKLQETTARDSPQSTFPTGS